MMQRLNQRGIALVATLGIGLALVALGLVLFSLARIEEGLTQKDLASHQAFWAAEAGLEKGQWWLEYTEELNEDVTDKPVTIQDNNGKNFFDGQILLSKTTDENKARVILVSKASAPTGVYKDEATTRVLKEELALQGSLGHDVAIAAEGDILYVDPDNNYHWHGPCWYHSCEKGCCKHHCCSDIEELAVVNGNVEIENIELPYYLNPEDNKIHHIFDSIDDFKNYFKNYKKVSYNTTQYFHPQDVDNETKLVFVEGDVHLYGNWGNKDVTFVATGRIYLESEWVGGCKKKCSHYVTVTTGNTGRLILIAYNKNVEIDNNPVAIEIHGNNQENVINGVICARGDVEFKGLDTHTHCGFGRWCKEKDDCSGGTFNGTILAAKIEKSGSVLAEGLVKLGVNWIINYNNSVITGKMNSSWLGLPYGLKLKPISWDEVTTE